MSNEIMSNDIAESLAKEIQDGTYTPSEFVDCLPALPVDKNPHVVRFNQFILFANPTLDVRSPQDPEYLILQQYQPTPPRPRRSSGSTIEIQKDVIVPLVNRLLSNFDKRPEETKQAKLAAILEPLRRAGFSVREAMAVDINNRTALTKALTGVLTKVFSPPPSSDGRSYQPFQPPYMNFALCAIYEQVWEPKGYTRGELISSISLAPGEQLTLDIHSWDKSTNKSEEELATESELRVSENLSQRDVHTVTRETSSQLSGNLSAAGVQIPGTPVTLGGNVSDTINNHATDTTENIRERTVQASHLLKNTRKLRIEVSREVGREQRQTRVLANTNRCHTLNCHYFEIMTNYLVTTKRVSLEPCLLLPLPKMAVTSDWVLCHENILKQSLLDKVFLDGFDGARVLETSTEFEEIIKEKEDKDVKPYVDAILLAYNSLLSAVEAFKEQSNGQLTQISAIAAGSRGAALVTGANPDLTQGQLRQVLYMAMLATDLLAWNALKKLAQEVSSGRDRFDGLKDFLAVVAPDHYRPRFNFNFSAGLSVLAISPNDFIPLIFHGFLLLQPDDAQLFLAVRAADKKMKAMAKSTEDQPTVSQEGFSTMEIAKARVSFDALKCHIEDNWVYYLQAIWMHEGSDQRFLRLQSYGALAAFLENNMMGFLGHKAAYLITDKDAVKSQIDFDAILSGVKEPDPDLLKPQLVTLPTQGTLLETIVGECDGCEDFIHESRAVDLRVQKAKAREEESEANRYEKRVENNDYSDPKTLAAGKIVIDIGGEGQTP